MKSLEQYRTDIIEDYKSISLLMLCKKYGSTKFLMKKFLIENDIEIKNSKNIRENILKLNARECSNCKNVLPLENFHKTKRGCGYRSICKKCRPLIEPYRQECYKKWREKNPELKSNLDKKYREKNSEKIKAYRKTKEYKVKKASWAKKSYDNIKKDPLRLLTVRIKSSMSGSIRYSKNNSYFKIVGYNIDELKSRLEETFTDNMSWDNYGRQGWHIDHIKPLALFDMSKQEDFIKAWSLNNLQALWGSENCSKGSMYENKRHYRAKNVENNISKNK